MRTTRSIPWLARNRWFTVVAVATLIGGVTVASAPAALAASTWPYTATITTGADQGRTVNLGLLANVNLEDVGTVAGQATLHVNVAPSPYECLNGSGINVFTFEGQAFLHNGGQGAQCAYGTWETVPNAIGSPTQMPVIDTVRLLSGSNATVTSTLSLTGANFGATPGSVILLPETATAVEPAESTGAGTWTPTTVTVSLLVPATSIVAAATKYYVLLLTSVGAAASTQWTPTIITPTPLRRLGIAPGTKVLLTPGSLVATVGSRGVRLRAAPRVVNGVLLAPAGLLASLAGAATNWDQATHQLRLATARSIVIFQLKSHRFTINGKVEFDRASPMFMGPVLLIPASPVMAALDFSLTTGVALHTAGAGAGATTFVITPCRDCGGSGGSGGNGGSGGSGGGTPVAKTITTVYGFRANPLIGPSTTNTWCNVAHAPSYLGGFALGSCTTGPQNSNNPSSGIASIGATVFGAAAGEVDQPLSLAYTSLAPAGVASTITVMATVDTLDTTYGLSGAGGSCAPTQINAAGLNPGTDTLATCQGTFQAVIPLGDVASITSSVMNWANSQYSDLSATQQNCLSTPQSGTNGAACAINATNAVMNASGTGLSVTVTQSPPFTYTASTSGGLTSYFTVDPEAQVSDVGLGTEINFMTSWVEFVVTEQYTVNQYAWTFPVAEAGQSLFSPWLQQCANANPISCQLVAGTSATVTSGTLPAGMKVSTLNGNIALAGVPAAGSAGVYQFTIELANGNLFDCTLTVGQPLTLEEQGTATTFYYETGLGFADARAIALPFVTSGGVGGTTWALAGNPPWLQIAYSPPTSTSAGSSPVLVTTGQVPTSGTYSFELQAWDDYHSLTSPLLHVQIVPPLALVSGPTLSLYQGEVANENLAIERTGGVDPVVYEVDPCTSCGAAPGWLSLNRTTGVLSGSAGAAGSSNFVVVATDARGASAAISVSVTVTALPQLGIQPATLPAGVLGSAYSTEVVENGSGGPPFTWAIAFGKLPPGLGLVVESGKPYYGSVAHITGKPTQIGSYSISLRLTDGANKSVTVPYTIRIT